MLNQPITSSPHWRTPSQREAERRSWRAIIVRGEIAERARAVARGIAAGVLAGGVLAAPLLVVLGLVLLFAPVSAGWRSAAPALIVVALLWLMVAIFGAHAHATPVSDVDKDDPTV